MYRWPSVALNLTNFFLLIPPNLGSLCKQEFFLKFLLMINDTQFRPT